MKRAIKSMVLPLALVFSLGAWDQAPDPRYRITPADGGFTRHVVVISVDGLRPDAIERYNLRTLTRLGSEGSTALDARTILPSKTLPSHTSMVTGLEPEDHGITFNRELSSEANVKVPTMFELARQEGFTTAAFYSKAKFRHLYRPNAYDYWQAPSSNMDAWMATRTVNDAVQYLEHARPNLLFVHIGEPDYAGHTTGWMSFFYGLATRRADAAVERILEAAEDAFGAGNFTVVVTADHGGHGRHHGTEAEEDVLIPWVAWGKGVETGSRPAGVRTMDTAATTLWLLGVTVPAHWDGQPVRGAFGASDPAPVAAGTAAGPPGS